MTFELRIDQAFDLELTLKFGQGHRWRPDQENLGWYTSVLGKDFVRICQPEGTNGSITFETSAGQELMAQKLSWQFRLDDPIEYIYERLKSSDAKMAQLVERYRGLRVMRADPWECLVFFVLSAHNHYQMRVPTAPTAPSIDEIAKRFWENESWPHDRYPFPSPETLGSRSGLDKLENLWAERAEMPSRSQARGEAPRRIRGRTDMPRRIHEAAIFVHARQRHCMRSGMQWWQEWESSSHAIEELCIFLRGVGPKTANCVALFGLGFLDAFPLDTHVTEALLTMYGRDPFQPYAGYASQLLFMEGLNSQSRR